MKILKALQLRPQEGNVGLTRTVSEIIARVRTEGDRALMDYNERFDHCTRPAFRVSKEEIENAYRQATQQDLENMRRTQTNLETFAQDGALPQILTKVHPKFRTPYVAILFLGLLTFLLVLTNSMNYIASWLANRTNTRIQIDFIKCKRRLIEYLGLKSKHRGSMPISFWA